MSRWHPRKHKHNADENNEDNPGCLNQELEAFIKTQAKMKLELKNPAVRNSKQNLTNRKKWADGRGWGLKDK